MLTTLKHTHYQTTHLCTCAGDEGYSSTVNVLEADSFSKLDPLLKSCGGAHALVVHEKRASRRPSLLWKMGV